MSIYDPLAPLKIWHVCHSDGTFETISDEEHKRRDLMEGPFHEEVHLGGALTIRTKIPYETLQVTKH